jgi:phage shock protein A
LTKEMMEDLLHSITQWLDELKDIKENGQQIDELYSNLETEASNLESHLQGLQQNIKQLDKKLAMVIERRMTTGTEKLIARRAF